MTLVGRLPFPPQPDESLRGLFLRLAQDSLCTGREFEAWLEVKAGGGFPGCAVATVAGKLGMEVAALRSMGLEQDGDQAGPVGLARRAEWKPFARMRWCPACLAEKPYHRRAWSWPFLRVCPVHGLKLRDRCVECEATGLSDFYTCWHRTGLTACSAGHPLPNQPTEAVADCSGAASIYRLCGLRCDGPELPSVFVDRPFGQTIEFVIALGFLNQVVAERNSNKVANVAHARDYRLLEAGVRIARGWPDTFDRLAEAVRLAYGSRRSLLRQYGRLYTFAASGAPEAYLPIVREAFAAHLIRRPDGPDTWPDFLPVPPDRGETVGLEQTRRLLGQSKLSFARLMKTVVWKDMPACGPDLFRRADVFALKGRLSRCVSIDEARSVLGLGKSREIEDFCRAAAIVPVPWASNAAYLAQNRSFELDDLERALARIRRAGRTSPPVYPVDWKTVTKRASGRARIGVCKLHAALLSGRLQAYVAHPDRKGLEAMTFEAAEVGDVIDRLAFPDV